MIEDERLKAAGARWYHSDGHASPGLAKSALGAFLYSTLKAGAQIGNVWPFNPRYDRSPVYFTVFMTPAMKDQIEAETRFKFRDPPKILLNSLTVKE